MRRSALLRNVFVLLVPAMALLGAAQQPSVSPQSQKVTLTYLGTAGWEITNGKTLILVDPYFTRMRSGPSAPGMPGDTGTDPSDSRHIYKVDEPVPPDTAVIDAHVTRADYILVTHAHFDHVMDVPYIAKKTHAQVIGNLSAINLMVANSIPESQLITIKGGEDYEFNDFSVRVIPSLHSALNHKHFFDPDVIPPDVKVPPARAQFAEGGTLAYLLRIGGHEILIFGANNFIEREIEGLRPDVVLAGPYGLEELHDYAGRMMRALGNPPLVLPTHWDNFFKPFDFPQKTSSADKFLAEVRRVSPETKTMVPKYFEPIALPPR